MDAARRRRSGWSDKVRHDPEIQELDETNGEWILCRTCAEHYERTHRGRKPNDPKGFKIKMNGKFQETAWILHKSRKLTHRGPTTTKETEMETPEQVKEIELQQNVPKRDIHYTEDESRDEQVEKENVGLSTSNPSTTTNSISLPTTGWRCPGIVPDAFYIDLVLAFAKYYVGSYRVNVVRDVRSDRVMLFSHDCENQIVLREHPEQPDSCNQCFSVWFYDKSFKQILNKMDRYVLAENILRHSWSLSPENIAFLSKLKHCSNVNLSLEGRKLKEAAMTAVQHFKGSADHSSQRSKKRKVNANHSERKEQVQQPLPMKVVLPRNSQNAAARDQEDNADGSKSSSPHSTTSTK